MAIKKPAITPSVYGRLVDRYLFNFRVDPGALQSRLPASWLKLQTAVVRKTWTRDVSAPVTQALTQLQASW